MVRHGCLSVSSRRGGRFVAMRFRLGAVRFRAALVRTTCCRVAVPVSAAVMGSRLAVEGRASQVVDRREDVGLRQGVVRAGAASLLSDMRFGVVQVAEGDRARRARVGTSRQAGQLESATRSVWPRSFQAIFVRRIRCTQKVHFSMTPIVRVETSGLSIRLKGSGHW